MKERKIYSQTDYIGERPLFCTDNALITGCSFADGESPLKECKNIDVENSVFKWKYPLWYCDNSKVKNTTWEGGARASVWYTDNITVEDCNIFAPKAFRRCNHLVIGNTKLPLAQETLWYCDDVVLDNVTAKGDYFLLSSNNVKVKKLDLEGNYSFDGGKNIEVCDSKLISKDAFWNCENVYVKDSRIIGEYIGWNSKNVTFDNCEIESLQGLCYIDGLKMINCTLKNTTLSFEYSKDIDAEINGEIESVKNPSSGRIVCDGIDELIMENDKVDVTKTEIVIR